MTLITLQMLYDSLFACTQHISIFKQCPLNWIHAFDKWINPLRYFLFQILYVRNVILLETSYLQPWFRVDMNGMGSQLKWWDRLQEADQKIFWHSQTINNENNTHQMTHSIWLFTCIIGNDHSGEMVFYFDMFAMEWYIIASSGL